MYPVVLGETGVHQVCQWVLTFSFMHLYVLCGDVAPGGAWVGGRGRSSTGEAKIRNVWKLEWRNLVQRNLAPILKCHCRVWYKLPACGTRTMAMVISYGPLVGCCYFLQLLAGCLDGPYPLEAVGACQER